MVVGAEWTSLEIAKLAIAALTPILLFVLGLMVSRAGRRVEEAQWTNRKLIERRLELYDNMAPLLNDLFVFFLCVGHFREIEPPDALTRKRKLDRIFYANAPLFSRHFRESYEEFLRRCFRQFTGPAQDAKLRTSPIRQRDERVDWSPSWDNMFVERGESTDTEIEAAYDALMDSFADEVGVVPSERKAQLAWAWTGGAPVSPGEAVQKAAGSDTSERGKALGPERDETVPAGRLADDLTALQAALDEAVPQKRADENLLIATWNVRALGALTDKWRSREDDEPLRDLFDIHCIAEVVSRFDIVAVQEVRGNLMAFGRLMTVLGPNWASIMTDARRGNRANSERIAFVFDLRRVRPSGLAGELAPESWTSVTALDRLFARNPYAVSFASDGIQLTLVTLHVLYGEETAGEAELREIAAWLARWARQERHSNQNLIALGDFNTDRRGNPCFDAFTSTGLEPAPQLNDVPRTIFGDYESGKFYDQIAWFTDDRGPILTLQATSAGYFDFVPLLKGDLSELPLSWRISDHCPLWVEFSR